MPAFIIYDSAGVVRGAYSFGYSSDSASLIARNTPEGMTALEVDPAHEVVMDQRNWIVQNGELTSTAPKSDVAPAPLKVVAFHELTVETPSE